MEKWQKAKILRFTYYPKEIDEANHYRMLCTLFIPFRDEQAEIEDMDCKILYEQNKDHIENTKKKYYALSDEQTKRLHEAGEKQQKGSDDEDDDENELQKEMRKEQEVSIDLFEQGGNKTDKEAKKSKPRYSLPKKISTDDMLNHLEKLNEKQRTFVMHVYKCLKTNVNVPFQIYLAGSAGVGKSTVINALYQLVTYYFDHLPGSNPDTLKVLITAFAGKAAFLVNGTTLHSAFALPVKKRSGNKPLVNLSDDLANTIRIELNDVKLIIIDEISMVDNLILNQVNARLTQVTGCSLPFGGISIIVVGDLNQLPPVSGKPVFIAPDQSDTAIFSDL